MSMTTPMATHLNMGRDDDHAYKAYLDRIQARFTANVGGGPVFTTDADGEGNLFLAYLNHLADRQHHNCNACRRFFESYGGLVTIDADGRTAPAIWDEADAPDYYRPAIAAVARHVRRSKVTGVFLADEETWGTPANTSKAGVAWHHYAVKPPAGMVYRGKLLTAGQAMAEKREDYRNVCRALSEYGPETLEAACRLLESDTLYRSEKVTGPARWLRDVHSAFWANKHTTNTLNAVWRAVATAPAGYCHPRSSMVGTLLDDLQGGMPFDDASRRFAAKMHPLAYQRPTAAPSAGNIAEAERIVEKLGIARSLERRFARPDEIDAIWRPKGLVGGLVAPGGVFGHLTPKEAVEPAAMALPAATMTWVKFARDVLPAAESIEYFVEGKPAGYTAFVTAAHADAPPILQWDREDRRNAASWYFWQGGSPPSQFGLAANRFCKVNAVTLKPCHWYGANMPHHGEGVVFVLDGARETRMAGNALFPEILKNELHAVRSTIEAYSRKAEIAGIDEPMAAGIAFGKGEAWNARLRVRSAGTVREYRIDRWD